MADHFVAQEKYHTVGKQLRYYIVYDSEDTELMEGSYYDVLSEFNWTDQEFDTHINNYRRPRKSYKQPQEGSYQIIELLPSDEEDEIKQYYDLLLNIRNQRVSFSLILEVIEACKVHHYLDKFTKEGVQLGLFNIDDSLSIPEKIVINLIMRTYAFLTIADDLYPEELSSYYKIPLWLVLLIEENYDKVFEKS